MFQEQSTSKSCTTDPSPRSVTSPTGLNTSPFLKPYPCLAILNDLTSRSVDPIPTVLVGPTSTVISKFLPVSVVAPTPNLDTPTTSRFSYDGCGMLICGCTHSQFHHLQL